MLDKVVGDYRIVRKLGEGGMGAVYVGVDTMLDREVAIKALRPALASRPEIVERFLSEAKTLARLNHPNVATLYSFLRHEGEYLMVLEFVRGQTFQAILAQRGAIPCEEAVRLFCQVLDGISHAHRLGIIHRDIKPSNLMLTEEGTLKVLDFGIARILGTERLTKTGQLAGTIEYMAPEQVLGSEIDERTDIYSLGMLLYQMLTGRAPFAIANEYGLMKAQIEQMPTPPRELNPSIPEEVERAVMRAVAKDPAERFQTAAEFRAALLGASLGQAASSSPSQVFVDATAPTSFMTRPSNPSFHAPRPEEAQAETLLVEKEAVEQEAQAETVIAAAASAFTPPTRVNETHLAPHAVPADVPAAAAPAPPSLETRPLTAAPLAGRTAEQSYSPMTGGGQVQAVAPMAQPRGKSSWPYYAAGAVVLLLVVSGLAVVAALKMSGGGSPAPTEQQPTAARPAEPATAPASPAAADSSAPRVEQSQPGAASGTVAAPADASASAQPASAEQNPSDAQASAEAQAAGDASQGQAKSATGTQRDRARSKQSEPLSRRQDMKKALSGTP